MLLVPVLDTRWGLAKAWPLGPMGVRPEITADYVLTIKEECIVLDVTSFGLMRPRLTDVYLQQKGTLCVDHF